MRYAVTLQYVGPPFGGGVAILSYSKWGSSEPAYSPVESAVARSPSMPTTIEPGDFGAYLMKYACLASGSRPRATQKARKLANSSRLAPGATSWATRLMRSSLMPVASARREARSMAFPVMPLISLSAQTPPTQHPHRQAQRDAPPTIPRFPVGWLRDPVQSDGSSG